MRTYIAKVIKIIDEYRIIVNLGSNDVSVGDKVKIFEQHNEIRDLSGKRLGTYEYCKDTLQVSEVFDHFCVCQAPTTTSTNTVVVANNVSSFLKSYAAPITSERKTLNIDKKQLLAAKEAYEPIRIGDLVKLQEKD